MLYFTTSWDDGSLHDIRLSKLLSKHHMTGTFYVPEQFDFRGAKFNTFGRLINADEIRNISSVHEIGAHTLRHVSLTTLTLDRADIEIRESKRILEDIIERPVNMFSFPNGMYTNELLMLVASAGYRGARNTHKLNFHITQDRFQMGVTIQVAPFPLRMMDKSHYYWRRILDPLLSYKQHLVLHPTLFFASHWRLLAMRAFLYARARGNYFHLYGHSWEIEKYDMWNEVENFFVWVRTHTNVAYVTNGQCIEQQV